VLEDLHSLDFFGPLSVSRHLDAFLYVDRAALHLHTYALQGREGVFTLLLGCVSRHSGHIILGKVVPDGLTLVVSFEAYLQGEVLSRFVNDHLQLEAPLVRKWLRRADFPDLLLDGNVDRLNNAYLGFGARPINCVQV